jgi:radical SAM superfamily enzyme YgiQ (UPF0313 family)
VEYYQEGHIFNQFIKSRKELADFTDDELEVMPNLALLTMAAYAGEMGHHVSYFEDGFTREGEASPFLDEPFDLAAISAFTYQAPRAYHLAGEFRSRGIPVILGGNHPTALPDEALAHAGFVIAGEGEDTFPAFLQDFQNGTPKRLYRPSRPVDPSSIPPPLFRLLKSPERYNKVPIQATRGCPYDCDFCSITAVYGHQFRKKPVPQVINEIRLAKETFHTPHISFVDENMLVDKAYAKDLLKALLPLSITWECYCDVSVAGDEDLLDLMRESGCYEIQVGFETVNPESLRQASPWKYERLKKYPDYVKTIQDHGVGVMGLFMLGMDGDGPDVFQHLWDFIRDNHIFEADLAVMQPLPGSRLFTRLQSENRITCNRWNHYTWYHINHQPANMTQEQLRDGMLWLHKKIHSPKWTDLKNSPLNPRLLKK